MNAQPAQQIPGVYHRKIGDILVTSISDGYLDSNLEVMLNVDRDRATQDLSADLNRPLRADEIARGDFSREVFPYVRDFYKDWKLPVPKPFYHLNGR